MRVFVGCECSGTVRDEFIKRGHDALSCDLLPTDAPGPHYQGDIRDVLGAGWDLGIFFPPCTYLANSGLHWNHRAPGRVFDTLGAVGFVKLLMSAAIPKIAIENPIGLLSTVIGKPTQIVQPWYFGHNASKATCLWLKNLDPLWPTLKCLGGDRTTRRDNQCASGQNKLGPSPDRWKLRSTTYLLIAEAVADQWG